jgi:outer membrane murein-binding lipoprotein Lpp
MSESESYEEVTVASNGITVIKTFEADAFPVPAIAFRIKSERTEAVTVKLVDQVPENVAVEDLGFHPEYGSEHWTIEDDEITFEREIESEEQYTTVYGIRATGTDDVEQFLTEPEIADVDPPLEDEDGVVGGSGSDVVRDVISGDTDSVPGLDEDEDEDEDIGTLDLKDPNAEEQEVGEEAEDEHEEDEPEEEKAEDEDEEGEPEEEEAEDEDEEEADEGTAETTNGMSGDVESIAAALASEIRDGNVDDDDLDVLRDELELNGSGGGGGGGAMKARIESLQTNVSDLEAYIDALEEFLEENGTGEDIIEDVQQGLDDVESQLSEIQSDIDSNNEQVSSLEEDVNSLETDLQNEVDELEGDLKSLKADIKDLDDDAEDMQETISSVENQLDDIEDVTGRVDEMEEDISDLQDWREQLSSVLGAGDD